ncbi:MAG TPA: histidine kinase dimerization/phospho-acceptor domain-containing protein [Candidatus Sulfotelmatobacter sp.]|jgi:signal transduction histidine kinase|nr:histidine kinase dimerization/phospho-acceptor domain-containing protein [Candidatus Sulfotelmatobacter sp.]
MTRHELLARISNAETETILPDLAELCRLHEVGLDLIERSHDLDELLDRVIDEYERRLSALPAAVLDRRSADRAPESLRQLKALVMFATQATALKEKALAAQELKRKSRMLEEANARLDGVLAALSSGIVVLAADGTVVRANAAARHLLGDVDAPGWSRALRDGIAAGADGEMALTVPAHGAVTVLVSRRPIPDSPGSEVVLVTDITKRTRDAEERVRLEKLAEVMKTLAVLSHKINNPLTALLGRAQILSARKVDDPQVMKAAAVIEESSQRIAQLIRELSAVVREGKHDAIEAVLRMPMESAREDA